MTFFKTHRKLHIWLLADLMLLAAFLLARGHRQWMNAWERVVSAPIRRALGSLCDRVSFSVMEVLYVLAAVLMLAYVVWSIAAVVRARGRRKRRACGAVLGAACAGLSICAATCLLLHGHLPGPVRHPGGGGIAPGSDGGDRVVRGKSGGDRRSGAPG